MAMEIKKKYLIASIKPTKVKTGPASVLLLLRNFADKMDGKYFAKVKIIVLDL